MLCYYLMPKLNPQSPFVWCYFVYGSQQTLECIGKEAKFQDLTLLDDFDQPWHPYVGSRVSGESIDHVTYDMKSTLVSAEVMARFLLAKEKHRKYLNY